MTKAARTLHESLSILPNKRLTFIEARNWKGNRPSPPASVAFRLRRGITRFSPRAETTSRASSATTSTRGGDVVKSNVDSRKDRRPPGTHFDGARMPYAMFFRGGYAMHQGYVPPFAASHGCIRLPGQMAVRFFENAPVGTSVTVTE